MDLLDQLEAENPEDVSLAPQEFAEWACVYIKYLQIFRKLEVAYDQMVHPQKLIDMKKALEACMGRMLEVRTAPGCFVPGDWSVPSTQAHLAPESRSPVPNELACMQVRHWLVKLNKGVDFMNIEDILVDLKLTPEELELPVPKYFKLDRAKVTPHSARCCSLFCASLTVPLAVRLVHTLR